MLQEFFTDIGIIFNVEYLIYAIFILVIIIVILCIYILRLNKDKCTILKLSMDAQNDLIEKLNLLEKDNLELIVDNTEKTSQHSGLLDRIVLLENNNKTKDEEINVLRKKDQTSQEYLVNFSGMMADRDEALVDLKSKLSEHQFEKSELTSKLASITTKFVNKESELAETIAKLTKEHSESIAAIEEQHKVDKELLKQEIEDFSRKLSETQSAQFSELSTANIGKLLDPFKDQLDSLSAQLVEARRDALQTNDALFKSLDISNVQVANMQRDAKSLIRALRGNNTLFGNWGQYSLERLLARFGLNKMVDYNQEVKVEGEGSDVYLDYVINLPEQKHIVIDNHINVIDYTKLLEKDDSRMMEAGLDMLINKIEQRAKVLSGIKLNGKKITSPDTVLFYIPIEALLYAIMEHKPDLFQNLLDKNICLVTNSNIAPIISVIGAVWKSHLGMKQLEALADQAKEILSAVSMHTQKLNLLGSCLSDTVSAFNGVSKSYSGDNGILHHIDQFSYFNNIALKSVNRVEAIDVDTTQSESVETLDSNVIAPTQETMPFATNGTIFGDYEQLFDALPKIK